ncbi:MerR family transcriptional regulator [Pseudalkalibacillus berkeleyi]|uniref:MerR family transcriptional regulator n=1 Tax=Pseudalkalibacillus berkeleyi TaxID=1069813 RepID=A0ABS9GYF8_9BACL|nr:MerR family transcriptional regulator [Pseudalkalibacillus berkeleyi]MCF6136679.1 MerR family transcriptional regulator [Pseudalkalibacillus berkeleyi]
MYKVKEVSEMVGVSVRTLHYYDQINLLKPESITPAGYRLYTNRNLERLQQILFFKEIGFQLDKIQEILDRPDFDRKQALYTHKKLLSEKKKRMEEMIRTVDRTIQSIEGGTKMKEKDMFNGFDMKEIEEHERKYSEEAKKMYGTDIVEYTQQRTSKYTKEDWARIQNESKDIYQRIADRMDHSPNDQEVQKAVGEWRQHITNYYYDCTIEIFRGLGDLYVEDERFTKNINKMKPGLAQFLRDAIHIYCDQQSN